MAEGVAEVVGFLSAAYDLYKASGLFQSSDPSVKSVVDAAVTQLNNIITDNDIKTALLEFNQAIVDYDYAVAYGTNDHTKWQTFDVNAKQALDNMVLSIQGGNGARYANGLGMAYNILLPIYLQSHLSGQQYGILPLPGSTSLQDDYNSVGLQAFKLNYKMIGAGAITLANGGSSPFTPATDTTRNSLLWSYVKLASSNSGDTSSNNCWGDNNICDVFFRTNATTQAVQMAQLALYHVLKDSLPNVLQQQGPGNLTSVVVDPVASWSNNWQGYNNAFWTAMENIEFGTLNQNDTCPPDSGIVGIWNIPSYPFIAFLCQPWPGMPSWTTGVSTAITEQDSFTCSSGSQPLCSYNHQCKPADFAIGGMTSFIDCYHRQDNQTSLPIKSSTCSEIDPNWHSNPMPARGAFTALPGGSYLTGYDLTIYHQWQTAAYYYCGAHAATDAHSLGAAFNLGGVEGTVYPDGFNVFAFGDIAGLVDVQGPVAGGGNVTASSFNLNWAGASSVAVVAGGNLTLKTGGTVHGAIYHGGSESISQSVTYNASTDHPNNPIDFANARTQLRGMSQAIGKLSGTAPTIAYGNITLKGIDPTVNVFYLPSSAFVNAYSITINVPSSSTVIINVSGSSVSIQNMGITNYGEAGLLWNLYEATSFYATSVGLQGSVLAPFANASLGGNIVGTLIAETVNSTNEFHLAPFQHNWLVP